MNLRRDRVWVLLRALLREARAERVTFMAGSIAYHAFVSLLPLLVLLVTLVSAVGSRPAEEALFRLTEAVLTPGAQDVLVAELRQADQTTGVSILGGALLVWGTLRIFRGLDTAFSDIYESGGNNSFTDQLRDGLLVFGTVALALLVGAAVETRFDALAALPGGSILGRVFLVVGLAVVLLPMYYVFPDEPDLQVREVIPGVVFTAIGLTVFQSLFGVYLQYSSRAPRESAVAGILVFLTWLYFSGLVILLGVVVNAVLSNRSADVDVDPVWDDLPASESATDSLATTLSSLDDRFADAREVSLSIDGRAVDLPAPDRIEVEREDPSLPFLTGSTTLHVSWSDPDDEE